jgi:hypothetical protein
MTPTILSPDTLAERRVSGAWEMTGSGAEQTWRRVIPRDL